ncbi:MAG: hypothetical protein UX88_C0003G0009 [Candidatus Woesebacteria bacterium GW2011_GWC2_47_16]|uniref:DUF192 domain-containing protein n=8 Tax=Candidatus Woeseibacteriota TaxID=1752722 RepID=A0A0G1T0U7_9BACT|nr:MAG: hypothetical protein UX03_C0004G0008 [Candidatus Woesebacteria bacterium GW2011_GWE1_45_18]KKU25005.1 MAG: hypothetical protein UX34_C0005G0009 [Candidatus Woesebacteria bacterium GW2011_GWF1_46_13]KKU47813.1 MAG: hypothetical protein UX67_C0028G0006 [Candidatus Woesebacteria bacterium GW2011_GWF2_46_8]KKU65280.1 MAG: hypothetical protein UX88_C0003G0009 [Candidatus Woesebacteria bacterium GW2011_GWC2_47_16]KKU70883.1 MAG: hypothetical protein UX95_C0011G0015 [Candidatus Woesebacteria b
MKKVILLLVATAIFIAAVGILTQKDRFPEVKEVKINNLSLWVEIADSEEERAKGLSGRKKLEEDGGMLFVFENKNVFPSFWMKEMLIPIDIIWINDGVVVKIDKGVEPEPGKGISELTLYYPTEPIDYVLEVNAGFSDGNGIKLSDQVNF